MNLQKLIYLVHLKNELNRKRKRFYYYMTVVGREMKCKGDHYSQPQFYGICKPTTCRGKHYVYYTGEKHITRSEARRGYNKAINEMKAMTSEIRSVRMSIGAKLVWDKNWRVEAVLFEDKKIKAKDFPKYYEAECFEMEMLHG